MNAKITSENFFDSISDDYTRMIKKCVPRYDEMLGNLINYLPEDFGPSKILELGCGSGNLTRLIIEKFPLAGITVVDLSGEILNVARNRFSNHPLIAYKKDDFRDLSFENGGFELILSSISIHHLKDEDKRTLFQNCFEWLSENGYFSFSDQFSSPLDKIYSHNISAWHNEAMALGSTQTDWTTWMEHQRLSDFHSPALLQMEWLAGAGFKNIDMTWRYLLWGNIVATR